METILFNFGLLDCTDFSFPLLYANSPFSEYRKGGLKKTTFGNRAVIAVLALDPLFCVTVFQQFCLFGLVRKI